MRPRTVSDEEILDVARCVFLEHGTHASADLIASRLKISQPALFKRFGTKKNLLIRALRPPGIPHWHALADSGPDERPFLVQFKTLAREIMTSLIQVTPLVRLVHTSGIRFHDFFEQRGDSPYQKDIKKISEWLARCRRKELIRETNFTLAAHSILGTLKMDTFELSFDNKMSTHELMRTQLPYLDECIKILWSGLMPAAGKQRVGTTKKDNLA